MTGSAQGILLASLIDRRYERPVLDTSIFLILSSFNGEDVLRFVARRRPTTNTSA